MTVEAIIGYNFVNKQLLREALTHPSCAENNKGVPFNYQRLEFLGDAVLGMAVAELLYKLYPAEAEGSLAKRHAALVRSESLAAIARTLKLGHELYMPAGEHETAREISSNLEDACEALIGALYLDGGIEVARNFIFKHWQPLARATSAPPKDAKTSLQEWAQGKGMPLPEYKIIETVGPAHAPEFTVEVSVQSGQTANAKAASKRQAEQLAAKILLEQLA